MSKKSEEVRRADNARQLLDNPLFKEAFATIRKELIEERGLDSKSTGL